MKKAVFCFLILSLLCVTASAHFSERLPAVSFTDMGEMPENHWSSQAVYTVAALDILKGSDGNFNPLGTTTRSEALAILMRGAGLEKLAEATRGSILAQKKAAPTRFNNVDSWADGYIRLAVDYGILTVDQYNNVMHFNYPYDSAYRAFIKEDPVTRLEFMEWFVRIFELPLADRENLITDYKDYSDIPQDKRLYMETALKYGLMKGDGEGLGLDRTISRQEVAQVLFNAKDLLCEKLGVKTSQKTVQSATTETTEANDSVLITKTHIVFTDGTEQSFIRTYSVNGAAVDYLTYFDTDTDVLTLRQNNRPEGTHLLEKNDAVTLYEKDGKLLFITAGQTEAAHIKEVPAPDFEEGVPLTAKLYYVDTDNSFLVLSVADGLLEVPYFSGVTCTYRGEEVPLDNLCDIYLDRSVTVFTAKNPDGSIFRAYHIQILGENI
ncbi:MAG: S-layer homology domain-containing protein [Clostridia bacterium]|nr:S-layer homology domain-containing protein [Clostridia bacterium]